MKRQRRKIGNLLKCIRRWRLIDALPPVAMMMIGLGFFFTVDLDTRIKKTNAAQLAFWLLLTSYTVDAARVWKRVDQVWCLPRRTFSKASLPTCTILWPVCL